MSKKLRFENGEVVDDPPECSDDDGHRWIPTGKGMEWCEYCDLQRLPK